MSRTMKELNSQGKAEAGLDRYQDGAIDHRVTHPKRYALRCDPYPIAKDSMKAREDRRDLHRCLVTRTDNLGWRRAR